MPSGTERRRAAPKGAEWRRRPDGSTPTQPRHPETAVALPRLRPRRRAEAAPASPASPAAAATASDGPPDRPGDFTPDELRFTPQRATRWFSPGVLTQSGLKVGVTSVFGSFLDKRELQSSRPCEPSTSSTPAARTTDLWLDYVADTGDGFEATATVAHHVARPLLDVDGLDRPAAPGRTAGARRRRGVPGGQHRGLREPARGALAGGAAVDPARRPRRPRPPHLYAVPGNHDWYDGLTGFLRMFGQGRWIGGWRTRQTRSYFAVQLPHRWWLWGVDIQSDALIDEPQLDYFEWVADEHCQRGRPHRSWPRRCRPGPSSSASPRPTATSPTSSGPCWRPAGSTCG